MNKLQVLGYRILIKPDNIEKEKNGILLVVDERFEKAALQTGTVLQVGEQAYFGVADGKKWIKKGDHVLFSKYGCKWISHPDDEKDHYILVNDEDILCKLDKIEETD